MNHRNYKKSSLGKSEEILALNAVIALEHNWAIIQAMHTREASQQT